MPLCTDGSRALESGRALGLLHSDLKACLYIGDEVTIVMIFFDVCMICVPGCIRFYCLLCSTCIARSDLSKRVERMPCRCIPGVNLCFIYMTDYYLNTVCTLVVLFIG